VAAPARATAAMAVRTTRFISLLLWVFPRGNPTTPQRFHGTGTL
jgi:hypothetical protein